MRRLASALFTLLVAATPAMAQPYADQPYPYDVDVDVDVDLDTSIYTDVSVAPLGEEIPDVSVFYDRLSPYGTWVDDSEYGYVFTPAETNYVPYSNGYWKLTDFGWTWIAADQHGWATSHYGRWVWRNRWVWRPDTTWGPAWVQWRESDNVVGWAPLGYDVDAYVPATNWRFIPTVYITSTEVSRYYVRADVARYVRDTRPIVRWNRHNDRRWVAGPDRAYLERNKVRVQRATYQPREIGRFDAAEHRQLEQRAAEAKVKYRARVTRDAQVRTQLEVKRASVERKQVEQHRQRTRQQPPRKQVEVQRQTEQRPQANKQTEAQQRQTEQRQRGDQQKPDQRAQPQREQAKQRNEQARKQQVEAQQRPIVEKQKGDRREQELRARQQVEERKLQDKQHEQNERRRLDERKQRQPQQREQQVEERKLQDKQHEQNERRQLDERRQAPQRQTQQREQGDQRREQPQQREQKQKVEQQRDEQPKARSDERRQPSPPDRERSKKDDRDDRKKK